MANEASFIEYGKELIENNTSYTNVEYSHTKTEENSEQLVAFHYASVDASGNKVELGLELGQPTEVFPLWVKEGDGDWLFVRDLEQKSWSDSEMKEHLELLGYDLTDNAGNFSSLVLADVAANAEKFKFVETSGRWYQ